MKQLSHHEIINHSPIKRIVLMCEYISDKRNLGNLFRIAEGFGVQHIYLNRANEEMIDKKVKRIARSSFDNISHSFYTDHKDQLADMRSNGFTIISVEICDQSRDIRKMNMSEYGNVALVLGAENEGVSPVALDESDTVCHIPMYGTNSSLNVMSALSIALYEMRRDEE